MARPVVLKLERDAEPGNQVARGRPNLRPVRIMPEAPEGLGDTIKLELERRHCN